MSERKNVTTTTVRRSLLGVFAGGLLGAAATATLTLPAANAAPDTCSASGVANTITSVSQSFSSYLVSHPETDKALTDIAKQPGTVAEASYQAYWTNNPAVADELRTIQQPVNDLQEKCGIQLTPSQAVSALEAI